MSPARPGPSPGRTSPIGGDAVAVAGQFVTRLPEADDAVWRRHELDDVLGTAHIVVGEDDVVLTWSGAADGSRTRKSAE